MAINDFLKNKSRKTTRHPVQVRMSPEYHQEVMAELERAGQTFQNVLLAGLESWMAERKAAECPPKKSKARSG